MHEGPDEMTSPTLSRAGNEAELRLRRSAIVLRDMCASRGQWTTHDDHPEGVDADEVFPGVIVGNLGAAKNALYLGSVPQSRLSSQFVCQCCNLPRNL